MKVQQIPFVYFHALNMTLLAYLVLVGVITATNMSPEFGTAVYVLTLLAFLGLRAIAVELGDAYGTADNDLGVAAFVQMGLANWKVQCNDEYDLIGSLGEALWQGACPQDGTKTDPFRTFMS